MAQGIYLGPNSMIRPLHYAVMGAIRYATASSIVDTLLREKDRTGIDVNELFRGITALDACYGAIRYVGPDLSNWSYRIYEVAKILLQNGGCVTASTFEPRSSKQLYFRLFRPHDRERNANIEPGQSYLGMTLHKFRHDGIEPDHIVVNPPLASAHDLLEKT